MNMYVPEMRVEAARQGTGNSGFPAWPVVLLEGTAD